jgi:hypothetical protein
MRFACRITKARLQTQTHLQYLIVIAFTRQKLLRERASVLRLYVHCLSLNNPDAVCLLRGTNWTFIVI